MAVGAPGTLTDRPAAFEVYSGFIVSFPILAWGRDRADSQRTATHLTFSFQLPVADEHIRLGVLCVSHASGQFFDYGYGTVSSAGTSDA